MEKAHNPILLSQNTYRFCYEIDWGPAEPPLQVIHFPEIITVRVRNCFLEGNAASSVTVCKGIKHELRGSHHGEADECLRIGGSLPSAHQPHAHLSMGKQL